MARCTEFAATYWSAHNARFAVAPREPVDSQLPLDSRLDPAHVFCLERQRVVGNDRVVRYDNRALQIVPTARAKRHAHPRGRVVVRETRTGELFVVARTPEGKDPISSRPPATRAWGQPLSARQVAARGCWSDAITGYIVRKAVRAVPSTPGTG